MIAALLALLPGVGIRQVSPQDVSHLHAVWLLLTLTVGLVLLLPVAPWLSLMALWFLVRWPAAVDPVTEEPNSAAALPSLVTWAAIGGTWFALRSIPQGILELLPWVWLALVGWQVGLMLTYRRPHREGDRPTLTERNKGTFGSPVLTALYFALVAPFCPWWGWPVLLVGLYLTWSWLAFCGVIAGLAMLYPWTLGFSIPAGLLAALAWYLTLERPGVVPVPGRWPLWIRGQPIFEWTPRGHSFDSVTARVRLWYLVPYHMGGHWLTGYGPYTFESEHRRWGTRYGIDLTYGEAHNELLQHLYEYGLIGVAAAVAFVVPLLVQLRLGDPWSAVVVVGLGLSLGHWPMRHAGLGVVWLTACAGVGR